MLHPLRLRSCPTQQRPPPSRQKTHQSTTKRRRSPRHEGYSGCSPAPSCFHVHPRAPIFLCGEECCTGSGGVGRRERANRCGGRERPGRARRSPPRSPPQAAPPGGSTRSVTLRVAEFNLVIHVRNACRAKISRRACAGELSGLRARGCGCKREHVPGCPCGRDRPGRYER